MAVLKNNKMVNLSLKELVTEMRETIHNKERFCFSDTIIDIESILEEVEKYGNYSFTLYWGVRTNGTFLKKELSEVETHYFKEIYKITYNNGKFSKERI